MPSQRPKPTPAATWAAGSRSRRQPALRRRLSAAAAAVLLGWASASWQEAQALPVGYIAQAIPSGGFGWITLANQLNDNGLVTGFVNDGAASGSIFAWSGQTGLTLMPNAGASVMHLNNAGWLLHTESQHQNAWTGKQLTTLAGGLAVSATPLALETGAGETQAFIRGLNNPGWMIGSSTTGTAVAGSSVWRADGTRAVQLDHVRLDDINDQGVAFGFLLDTDGRSTRSLVSWSEATGLRTLAPLSGETWRLNASDTGSVVLFGVASGATALSGYTWSAAAGLASLAIPAGRVPGQVNDQGLIIGDGLTGSGQGPFVQDGGVVRDLRSMVLRFDSTGGGTGAITFDRAMDINDRGQILLTGHAGATAMSFLLSPCTTCGQITPNPNPSGHTLLVDANWYDAFNAEPFHNQGELVVLQQALVNRAGASLVHAGGQIRILSGGEFFNDGALEIQPSGAEPAVVMAGALLQNGRDPAVGGATVALDGRMRVESGRVRNHADWTVRANGSMEVMAQGVLENRGLFVTDAGSRIDLSGQLDNAAGGELRLQGLLVTQPGATLGNSGNLAVGPGSFDPDGSSFRRDGVDLQHLGDGALTNHGEFINQGRLAITGVGDKASTRFYNTGRFVNAGRVDIGSVYLPSPGHEIHIFERFVNVGEVINTGLFDTRDAVGVQAFDQQGFRFADRNDGRFSNSGTVTLQYAFINGQRGEVENSRSWMVNAQTFTNHGWMENRASALLSVAPGAVLRNTGIIDSQGVLNIAAGGTLENEGGLVVGGTGLLIANGHLLSHGANGTPVRIAGGTLGGSGVIDGDVRITPLANLDIQVEAGTLEFIDDAQGGRFELLEGEFVLAESLGTIAPGNSPGTLTIQGNLSGTLARLQIDVASASVFDRLVVTGEAAFHHAVVTLLFQDGYSPDLNDSFAWLSSGNLWGADTLHYRTSGLTGGWRLDTTGTAGGEIAVWNDAAVQIAPNPNPDTGQLSVAAGALAFNAESFINDGVVEVAGALANRPGASIVQGQRGLLRVLAGGRASNRGEILSGGLHNDGLFDNRPDGSVSVDALTNGAGALLTNRGTLTVTQATNQAGGTVDNSGVWTNLGRITNDGQFTVSGRLDNVSNVSDPSAPPGVVQTTGIVQNHGMFTVTATGEVAGDGVFVQTGLASEVLRVDGRFAARRFEFMGGTLTGSGRLVGDVALTFFTTVEPGNGGAGTLTLDGDLAVDTHGLFIIELAGDSSFDRLVVTGDAALAGGRVEFRLTGGFDPFAAGTSHSVTWLHVAGQASGLAQLQWAVVIEPFGAGNGFQTLADANGIYLGAAPQGLQITFHGDRLDITAAPVPEPGTWALMLAGLGLLGRMRRAFRPA